MAGIGFELKKIYQKDDLTHGLAGAAYSTFITIGPTLIVIGTILALNVILNATEIAVTDRELLSATIFYAFIFSTILTSPIDIIFSRYLADKFFVNEFDDILSSYYLGVFLCSVIAMALGVPFMLSMYFRGGVDLPYVIAAYVLWVCVVIVFFTVTYVQAAKDYRLIAFLFIISMAVGAVLAVVLDRFTAVDKMHSIIYGLATSFLLLATLFFTYIRYFFRGGSHNYREVLSYLRKYWRIGLANLFYILGMYVSNFIFWTMPGSICVAKTFYCHAAYDNSSCLAVFTSISATVIFTVKTETEFHEAYENYMEAVVDGTYNLIEKNRRIMFRTLNHQLKQIFVMQTAISCVIFSIVLLFGTYFGFGAVTMTIYPVHAAAYFGLFMMYFCMVFLYYFDDSLGALLTGLFFMLSVIGGTYLAAQLSYEFYALGLFAGMLVGYTFAFFRIRHCERIFETHIFCRGTITEKVKNAGEVKLVYRKADAHE